MSPPSRIQVQYDPASLSLVNVNPGDLLSRDGQAVALVHRDDGPGNITINAARPPGAPGVNGAGVVCVLSFQARARRPELAGHDPRRGRYQHTERPAGHGKHRQHYGEVIR